MAPIKTLLFARRSLASVIPLMRDARVPMVLKAMTVALGVIIVSPLDLLSDIPILGVLDDGLLLTLLCVWFVRRATRHSVPAVAVAMRPVH